MTTIAGPLTLAGVLAVNGTTGSVTLNAPGGITEPGGGIIAGFLAATAGGAVDLAGSNAVGTLAAIVAGGGSFDFADSQSFTVGTVAAANLSGVTTFNGNIVLKTTAGDIALAQPVNTVGGGNTLSGSAAIGLLSAGGISQSGGGQLVAPVVEASAVNAIALGNSSNRVATFAGQVTGSSQGLVFGNDQANLTIGTVQVAAGSVNLPTLSGTTTNGGTILLDGFLALTLNQTVNANNGSTILGNAPGAVEPVAGNDLTQGTAGAIVAGQLEALSFFGNVALTAANHIGANDIVGIAQSPGSFAGSAPSGDLLFVNHNAGINVVTILGTQGVSARGDVRLATTGAGAVAVNQRSAAGGAFEIAVAPTYGFTNNALVTSGGPTVILADGMSFPDGSGINAGSGTGTVVLGPATAADKIVLGAAGAAGTLGIGAADLTTITAGALQIGYGGAPAFGGAIDVAGNVQFSTAKVPELLR